MITKVTLRQKPISKERKSLYLDFYPPIWDQDKIDTNNLFHILETKVIPMYYDNPQKWQEMVFNAMDDVIPEFTTQRMADDYYKKLFNPII